MANDSKISRYITATKDEFEPGSDGKVLRNKLGIVHEQEMHDTEILHYRQATIDCFKTFTADHSFSMKDVLFIHKKIFGKIYSWAGKYREQDMSKDGFMFTRVIFFEKFIREFSEKYLTKQTPPSVKTKKELARILAEIHVEFILLHPFREGNGRTIRLLMMLIAQQAGYKEMNFDFIAEGKEGFKNYIKAIHAGQGGNYKPMALLMERALG